jgi:SAM-dependent methyltransferase
MAGWISYEELAWVDLLLASPESCSDDVEAFCRIIEENSLIETKSLLHLASGAGIYDYTFKRHFQVTGIDISDGMLAVAHELNPEVHYIKGDMRTTELGCLFDAVVIPDAIAYMTTRSDLQQALATAVKHLKPGGVLFIVAHTRDEFRENNFTYCGSRDDLEVTVFENNYILKPSGDQYEATIIYLIRRAGELQVYTDRHLLGLFGLETWQDLLNSLGLKVSQLALNTLYDKFLLGDGEYRQTIFVCTKPL